MENELKIIRYGYSGEGIAVCDNKVVFVPYALKNEDVTVEYTKRDKKFDKAVIKSIIMPSDKRVTPPCPYFKVCGGCDLQHMNYDEQLDFKTQLVQDNLNKYSKIDIKTDKCANSELQFNYRNKITLYFTPDGELGMFKQNTHIVQPIKQCMLAENEINNIIPLLNSFFIQIKGSMYNWASAKGNVRGVEIKHYNNQFLITVLCCSNEFAKQNLLIDILNKANLKFGIYVCCNNKDNTFMWGHVSHVYGLKFLDCEECGLKTNIKALSFGQVNNDIKNKIYEYVANAVVGKTIVDAYAGRAVLSAIISKHCDNVFAIEIEKNACDDATLMLQNNKIDNVKIICGDCSNCLPELVQNTHFDCLVVDPPRNGCEPKMLDTIIDVQPKQVIYISCNSSTLARDLKVLCENVYKVQSVKTFDMFPQTANVETVVILNKYTK